MLFKVLACAGIVILGAAQGATAQSLNGPRELPPPGYAGQQYVDSAGCVFLRAGINGRVTWVARVDRERRQLCGYPASGRTEVAVAPEVEETAPAPAPAPVAVVEKPVPEAEGGPIDTVASITTAPRIVRRAPVPVYAPAPVEAAPAAATGSVVATATPGCPSNAPYGERRVLADGRLALLCARDSSRIDSFAARLNQTAEPAPAAEAPIYRTADTGRTAGTLPFGGSGVATGGRVLCPVDAPRLQRFEVRGGGTTLLCTDGAGRLAGGSFVLTPSDAAPFETARHSVPAQDYVASANRVVVTADARTRGALPAVPRGYVRAWKDDRLNPLRGVGTAEGQYAQDQVWTREVPARLVSETVKVKRRGVVVSASNKPVAQARTASVRVTTSTSTAPKAAVSEGGARLYVQVGSYGVPANAEGARARLAGLGLPAAGGKGAIKGKTVQVVYAGPFGSVAQAQAALNAARRAGFGDAFIR